jgi:polar amino acid transport system substrate-binding protein/cystine transport system substrate-binding protein/membrane-bound lytic murein transglycosylase F
MRLLLCAHLWLPAGVYALPPDTSLSEVRKAGLLRVACRRAPPLVTGNPDAPGIDVELVQAMALQTRGETGRHLNQAMGQDFNPRNWRVTRAQCEVLAGGVVASPTTRSFLETSPSYAQTGWALVVPKPPANIQGRRVGVLTGISGLDRLALSRYLRAQAAEVTIVPNAAEFVQGLRAGRFDIGVTERLLGGQIAAREGWGRGVASSAPLSGRDWPVERLRRGATSADRNPRTLARWQNHCPICRRRARHHSPRSPLAHDGGRGCGRRHRACP